MEIADVVRQHGAAFRRAHLLSREQHRALDAIEHCRTATLGGHVDVCRDCGFERPAYNSCRNRHCPKCQSLAQARWVARRMQRLLPVGYFHVVFTLPAELRATARLNRRLVFALLLESAAAALVDLGLDPKRLGGLLGVTAVLHTWTRELGFHPHVHCIVTAGAFRADGDRWVGGSTRFLFPVHVLGSLFRGKVLAGLRKARKAGDLHLGDETSNRRFEATIDKLYRTSWVVYAKRPFGGAEHVLRYLGRYTHRVGISNQRLTHIDDGSVTFRTKNGRSTTLPSHEFLRRGQQARPEGRGLVLAPPVAPDAGSPVLWQADLGVEVSRVAAASPSWPALPSRGGAAQLTVGGGISPARCTARRRKWRPMATKFPQGLL